MAVLCCAVVVMRLLLNGSTWMGREHLLTSRRWSCLLILPGVCQLLFACLPACLQPRVHLGLGQLGSTPPGACFEYTGLLLVATKPRPGGGLAAAAGAWLLLRFAGHN